MEKSNKFAWNGYPARLMADYILGIRASGSGFARVKIEPYFTPKLTYAKGTVKTVRGDVTVRWERKAGTVRLFATLPGGTSADVVLPGKGGEPIRWEEGSHYLAFTEGEALGR